MDPCPSLDTTQSHTHRTLFGEVEILSSLMFVCWQNNPKSYRQIATKFVKRVYLRRIWTNEELIKFWQVRFTAGG